MSRILEQALALSIIVKTNRYPTLYFLKWEVFGCPPLIKLESKTIRSFCHSKEIASKKRGNCEYRILLWQQEFHFCCRNQSYSLLVNMWKFVCCTCSFHKKDMFQFSRRILARQQGGKTRFSSATAETTTSSPTPTPPVPAVDKGTRLEQWSKIEWQKCI